MTSQVEKTWQERAAEAMQREIDEQNATLAQSRAQQMKAFRSELAGLLQTDVPLEAVRQTEHGIEADMDGVTFVALTEPAPGIGIRRYCPKCEEEYTVTVHTLAQVGAALVNQRLWSFGKPHRCRRPEPPHEETPEARLIAALREVVLGPRPHATH